MSVMEGDDAPSSIAPAEPTPVVPETPAPPSQPSAPAEALPPPSPPFQEVSLAPQPLSVTGSPLASPPSPTPGAAGHCCSYCDVPTLGNLGEALLTSSVEAAVLSTTGNVFEKAEPRIQPLFNELASYLKSQTSAGTLPVREWCLPSAGPAVESLNHQLPLRTRS